MSYTYEYPRPSVTVDAVVLQAPDLKSLEILLIKRRHEPFQGLWALPGGFLDLDEQPLTGAKRELEEETGVGDVPLKPVFACGQMGRDPRSRCVTMVFGCLVRNLSYQPEAGDDAAEAKWFSLFQLPKMAFDHNRVIKQVIDSLSWQAKTAIIGQNLFKTTFNANDLAELQSLLTNSNNDDFINRAIYLDIIRKDSSENFTFNTFPSEGPDWHKLVW